MKYREEPPSRWPANFDSWPRDEQVNVVCRRMKRAGLIREMLNMAEVEMRDEEIHEDSRLTKKELAAIYLAIQGVGHEE